MLKQNFSAEQLIELFRIAFESSNINLLVGAGASAGPFSTLENIETCITEIKESAISEADKMQRLVLPRASYFNGVMLPNIELLNTISSEYDPENKFHVLIHNYKMYLQALYSVLSNRKTTLFDPVINIFTTNIDIAHEVAADEAKINLNIGVVGQFNPTINIGEFALGQIQRTRGIGYISQRPTINLLHIHGAVYWKNDNGVISIDRTLSFLEKSRKFNKIIKSLSVAFQAYSDNNSGDTKWILKPDLDIGSIDEIDKITDFHEQITDFHELYDSLGVVNPEKTKFATTVLNHTYYDMLRTFANELERPNTTLVVFGFSFADEHIRHIVLRAANTNPTLQILCLCYNEKAQGDIAQLFESDRDRLLNGNLKIISLIPNTTGTSVDNSLSLMGSEIASSPRKGENDRADEQVIDLPFFANLVAQSVDSPSKVR